MDKEIYEGNYHVLKEVFNFLAQDGNEITALSLSRVFPTLDPVEYAEVIGEVGDFHG
tara:strand:- start:846 stop:1016 length:171 start_codon:yes stop_codon:yes gene_type:complete